MSRLFFPYDTDGDPGGLGRLVVPDYRTEQKPRPRAAGSATNVRPLTLAEVLPPHLRSGSSPGVATSVNYWPLPNKALTPKLTGVRELLSVRHASLQPDNTPRYRPGRYAYNSGIDLASAEKSVSPKPIYNEGYGSIARGATRNLLRDFRDAQTQSQPLSTGISDGGLQESANSVTPKPVKAEAAELQAGSSSTSHTGVEDYSMMQGEFQSSRSAWLGSPSPGWQGDVGTPHRQPAIALTSTLVARMEALRQQLLRVSSTLTGVQERAAHLASSMGNHSQSLLYNDSSATAAQEVRMPVMPPEGLAATSTAIADLPTQRYLTPDAYMESTSRAHSASPYSTGITSTIANNNAGETRLYMVSVSAASDPAEPAHPPPPPATALQRLSPPPQSLALHHQRRSPPKDSSSPQLHYGSPASVRHGLPSAAAAAAAAYVASYKPVPDLVASSPRPQRSPPAIAVHLGALEDSGFHLHHPFELGSPAGRTVHVALPQTGPSMAGPQGAPHYISAVKHSDGSMTTPISTVRQCDRGAETYDVESSDGAPGKGYAYYPRGGGDGGAVGSGDSGTSSGGEGHQYHQSASASSGAGAGARGLGPSAPATALRPTAVAAAETAATAAASVAQHTMASAFVRQLDSPVLRELLMQSSSSSSRPRPQGVEHRQYQEHPPEVSPWTDQGHMSGSAAVVDTAVTTASSHDNSRYRRYSASACSNGSSADAERVHPWNGGGGGGSTNGEKALYGLSSMSPSAPLYLPRGGGVRGGGSAASVGSNEAAREGHRLSGSGLSDMSSIDAARVYPWVGVDDPNVRLRSADGSLELMAAAPLSYPVYGFEAGGEAGRGDERRTSISGRSIGDGCWLLLSPTVVVKEVVGGGGEAVRSVEEVMAVVADQWSLPAVTDTLEVPTGGPTNAAVQQQDEKNGKQEQQQQQECNVGLVTYAQDPSRSDEEQEEMDEKEPSVAPSPVSTPMGTPYHANGEADSGSGSTTPTPCADLSFAFHSASFAARDADGNGNPDGKEWLHHVESSDGSAGRHAHARPARLAALGSRGVDEDEILQTPTHGNAWEPLKLRFPGAGSDGAITSDGESDACSAGAGGGLRRWSLRPRDGRASSSASGANGGRYLREGSYDGYSEEEEDRDVGGGGGNAARGRRREAMRSIASAPSSGLSSTVAQRAAVAELYHSFSFPLAEERVTTTAKSAALTNAAGGGGTGAGLSSTSGGGAGATGSSGVSAGSNMDDGAGGTPDRPDTASGSVAAHHLARPSRIVVPSSPRSSLGGWSLPSPIPSPYTHGGAGVRTPSSGGPAANFSLRKHLDLTVSSCLFGDTSSEEGVHYDYDAERFAESRLAGGYDASPPQRQLQRACVEGEVEEGEEVTSRLMPWQRSKGGDGGQQKEDEEENNDGEAQEVEEEDIPVASDDDEATAAVAAWAYGDARRAAEAARDEGSSDLGCGQGGEGQDHGR